MVLTREQPSCEGMRCVLASAEKVSEGEKNNMCWGSHKAINTKIITMWWWYGTTTSGCGGMVVWYHQWYHILDVKSGRINLSAPALV